MKYTNCNYILLYTQQAIQVNNMAPITRLVAVSGWNSWLPWHTFVIYSYYSSACSESREYIKYFAKENSFI